MQWTPEGWVSGPDLPEEESLEEWKKKNILSTPINPPLTKEDLIPGGGFKPIDPEDIPRNTGEPIPPIELPTHTGSPIPEIELPTILTMAGQKPKITPEMTEEVFETLDDYFIKDKDGKIISTTVGPERDIIKKTISDVVDKYGVDKAIRGSVVQRFLEQALKNKQVTKENYDIYLKYRDKSAVSKINPANIERTRISKETSLLKGQKLLEVAQEIEAKNKKDDPNSITGFTHQQLLEEATKKYPTLFSNTNAFEYAGTHSLHMKPFLEAVPEVKKYLSGPGKFGSERITENYTVAKGQPRMDIKFRGFVSQNKDLFPGAQGDTIGTQKEKSRFLYYVLSGMRGGNAAIRSGDYEEALETFEEFFPGGFNSLSDKSGPSELKDQFIKFKAKDDVRYKLMNLNQGQGEVLPDNPHNIRPFLQEVFGENVKLNMAHDFERGIVRKENALQSFADKGGDASFINIDLDVVNTQIQPEIEKEIRKLENIEAEELSKPNPNQDILDGIDFKVKKLEEKLVGIGGQGLSKYGQIGQSIPFYDKLNQIIDEYNIKAEMEGRPSAMKKYPNLKNALELLKKGDGKNTYADGGTLKFNDGSRLNDYDPYDINQFQMGQFPSYESLYGDQGKFPVKEEYIEAARAKALEEGKKYYGDATQFEIFKDGLFNMPDGFINYLAGSAEGIGELGMGLFEATKKGLQMQTFPTDQIANLDKRNISKSSPDYSPFSDKFQALLDAPAFTKYMGEFRGKIPRPNLADEKISGLSMDEFGEKIGYYTGPPTAVLTAPYTLGKMLTGASKASKATKTPISEVSKLADEEIVTPLSKVDEAVEETIEVTPKRTETKTIAEPEIQIEKPKLDPKEVERANSLDTYIAPRWSKVDEYVQTKYSGSASKSKKKLSKWKKELEDADGANLKTEMKDNGMSFQIGKLIEEGGDETIDAVQFLNLTQELLGRNNQIKRGYSEFVGADQLGNLTGAAKVGTEITPDATRQVVSAAKSELANIPVTATGKTGRVLQEYKMAVQSMIDELEVLAGGTSKRTFKGTENPSLIIDKYTKQILPNILKKAKNPNINLLYTEAQKMNGLVDRFKRLNVNPRLSSSFKDTGWPGTRTEDYSIIEQGFTPQKGQASRHEAHNTGHPSSPNAVSWSRSIDKTTTDGRVTENIMEAQSDVHRATKSYRSPEDLEGINILENAEKKLKPQADKALDDAWNQFTADHKLYKFDTDPINMPAETMVPDMFEIQLKSGTADNPIWEVINTRTKRKVPKKSFGTEDDAQIFADAKTKLEWANQKKKPQPTGFDVKLDQVSNDLFQVPFKSLKKSQQQNVKRAILDNYGTVNQKMIDEANEFLSGLTTASKKELGKARNPNFLNAQRISKLEVGDSAFGNYDKFWSRKMSTGEEGQKSLIERLANMDELPRSAQNMPESSTSRVQSKIKEILDNAQGGKVTEGPFAGVDAFTAIKAEITQSTGLPVEEFLARVFPDEVKFSGSYADISKNAKLRRKRYEEGSQDYPFKKQKDWVKNVLKSHIEKAISEGKTNVSWNPGEIVGVYESANAKDIIGYKTIYNKLMVEAAEDLNKDLVARAIKLGIDPDKAKIKVSGVGEDMNFTLQFDPSNYQGYKSGAPDLVNTSFDKSKMEVSGLPYVDFSESIDIIRKIGLPQHADGGRVGSKLPDIDEMIGTL